jgi:hypothetical protein
MFDETSAIFQARICYLAPMHHAMTNSIPLLCMRVEVQIQALPFLTLEKNT